MLNYPRSFASRPRAVLLDLDDTLYPEREYVISGINAVSEFLASRADLHLRIGSGEIARQCIGLLDEGRGELFDRLLVRLGVSSPSLLGTLVHVYRAHQPRLALFSDVAQSLDRLKRAGILLGIVTDGKATVQRKKIEALALGELVATAICSDDLLAGCGKPSKVPFEVALGYLQVPPEAAVYIGDDLSKDFIGPRGLGMGTIRIAREHPHPLQPRSDFPEAHQADAVCRDLRAAADLLLSGGAPTVIVAR